MRLSHAAKVQAAGQRIRRQHTSAIQCQIHTLPHQGHPVLCLPSPAGVALIVEHHELEAGGDVALCQGGAQRILDEVALILGGGRPLPLSRISCRLILSCEPQNWIPLLA